MIFPKDEELFRDIPGKNQRIYDATKAADPSGKKPEPIRDVYNRVYRETADKILAEHHGSISSSYTDSLIQKDLSEIAHALDRALQDHLDRTDGYIGVFPQSEQYFATVDREKDYYFYYLGQCMTYYYTSLLAPLKYLNALVYTDGYRETKIKNVVSTFLAVLTTALMWFFQSWFFTYEGLGVTKILALAAVFCGLFGLAWWSSHDPSDFAFKMDLSESPVSTVVGFGLVAAAAVRIFFSGATAARICCVIAALFAVCYVGRILKAGNRLRQIRTRSPKLRELSSIYCKDFERNALSCYRMIRFLELWYESEGSKPANRYLESLRPGMMKYVDEYEQWRRKYLKDGKSF